MSDGHFYNCKGEPFLTDASTPAQAKKVKALPSVTTILGIQKNEFLDEIWGPRKLVELAREFPFASTTELKDMRYGFRINPENGSPIKSSDFGTAVHARLEDRINYLMHGKELQTKVSPFDGWADPFIEFIAKNKIEPVHCEKILYCNRDKSAGSVDFIAKVQGKYHLFDYKCRNTKGTGGKFYETKDCTQLAIESKWLQKDLGLDYEPAITSVCICTESRNHYHKNWNGTQARKGVQRFRHLAKLYWMDWMRK
tara:strand:+ start:1017 stop:1778 length:762 start_codon:yes stop_codon:yes gene_type:complete